MVGQAGMNAIPAAISGFDLVAEFCWKQKEVLVVLQSPFS